MERELDSTGWNGQEATYNDSVVISYDDLISISDADFKKIRIKHNKQVAADEKQKQEQEAENQRLREEQQKREKEEAEEAERLRQVANDGDKAILNEFMNWFGEPVAPEGLKSKKSKETLDDILKKYKAFKSWASSEIEKIK